MTKPAKRAVAPARKATDKRVVGSAQNPQKVRAAAGASAGEVKPVKFSTKRPSRGAGRPKKVS